MGKREYTDFPLFSTAAAAWQHINAQKTSKLHLAWQYRRTSLV